MEKLIIQMKNERNSNCKGIYYITQVELAYNSNKIEVDILPLPLGMGSMSRKTVIKKPAAAKILFLDS
jgi:hypothetical protein